MESCMAGRDINFVISFEPGETDADEAYEITKEICKKVSRRKL